MQKYALPPQQYTYPTELTVKYNTVTEFRECIRRLFSMSPENYLSGGAYTDDEETRDEMAYDYDSSAKAMDKIYDLTKDNPVFKQLFLLAASKMMSMDDSLGLSILFAYDYLELFHQCMVAFLTTPTSFNAETKCVAELKEKLR
jgi:hypothetical protein